MLFLFCAALAQVDTTTWYGPAVASYQIQFNGNPYDPAENDVHVKFLGEKAQKEDRIAYFDQKLGAWRAGLVTPQKGAYRAELWRNGELIRSTADGGNLDLTKPLPHGFVHVDPHHPNRFRWDDGTPFVPIGFDLGWQNGDGFIPMTGELAKMGANGVNWTRIWACNWDGMNPWWPMDNTSPKDQLWAPALGKWEELEKECEKDGVGIQMVLFHHGEFSSYTDPNWPDSPWNAAKGGFLKDPADFFTDPEAKRRTKIWLRYAVARYGASPQLFGWELFNEVQWVNAVHENRWGDIEVWHKEMAEYIRSIDPYHHMVTTSSEQRPGLNAPMDYVQPHTYPSNILASVMGTAMPTDKPGFYGEFGPGNTQGADMRAAARDGLFGGLLANDAGSGMFWYWDAVEQKNLYNEYANGRKAVEMSGWAGHPDAKIANLKVETPGRATFSFSPGLGWGATTQTTFDLPDGATTQSLGKISSYFQGKSHADMMPGPLTLRFAVPKPSVLTVNVGKISDSGGNLNISVDGKTAYQGGFKKGQKVDPVVIQLAEGRHEVQLLNDGPDWFTLNGFTITNLAPQAQAEALAESDWMFLRVTGAVDANLPLQAHLTGVQLADGSYDVRTLDLDSGMEKTSTASVKDFELQLELTSKDTVISYHRKP